MATISRGRIFICYRRQDTRHIAGRIYDSLIAYFGDDDIFMDVDAIEPGLDFADEITKAVASCDVLLAVIGHNWLKITDPAGRRRLDNPRDFVRLEIETALQRDIRVIPVLTDDAALPREDELPDTLAGLVRRQAVRIRHDRYRDDVSQLMDAIGKVLVGQAPKKLARTGQPKPASVSQPKSSKASGLEGLTSNSGVEGPALAKVEPDLIHVLQHDDTILRVAFSSDSRLLITASKDETARVWEDGQQRHQLLHSDSVNDISVSRDGNFLATVTAADDIVRLWSPQTGLIVDRFTADSPNRVLFSPFQELLAAYSDEYNRSIFVWRYSVKDTWSSVELLERKGMVLDLDFGGKGLLAITSLSTAQIWNASWAEKERFIHKNRVTSVNFNKGGGLLATASLDGTARIWDSKTGQEYHRLRHDKRVEQVLFSPDATLIATVSANQVYIWDPRTGHKYRQLGHDDQVQEVQFSPDGQLLVTCSGSAAHLWNPGTGDKFHQLEHDDQVQEVQFSPDGQLLVTCSGSAAQVWHMQGS